MAFPRSSGIQLHPTSLPGYSGIGSLGPEARLFADFLASAGQTLWQVLPLGPTGYGDSPYQCFSALAGNPLLISIEDPSTGGLSKPPEFPHDEVDYASVIPWKTAALDVAAERFRESGPAWEWQRFEDFCYRNAGWLDDFALFMALKRRDPARVWTDWDEPIRRRDESALKSLRSKLAQEIATQKFLQYRFFAQWASLRDYCHDCGVRLMGDLPIYVAHDSVDVWVNPHFFQLDEAGKPRAVAGVPPDYFSATGQLWGNPLYDWDCLERDGYRWWISRFRAVLDLVDVVRLDHFRGFEAYWEIPADSPTAQQGCWVKGPGSKLFRALREALGPLPVVAENLGVITPEVEGLRAEFGFPGMSILQFAFGADPQAHTFQPHNYPRELVAYSGTHDCDTTVGWWTSAGRGESTRSEEDILAERQFAARYLHIDRHTEGDEIHWVFMRTLLASVADTVIFPLQDVLGLGSGARMNQPATTAGNWRWRCTRDLLTEDVARRLRALTELYERSRK
jgi:4-alpha-glucanotransferase